MKKIVKIILIIFILSIILGGTLYYCLLIKKESNTLYPVVDSYLIDYDNVLYPYDGMIGVEKDGKLGFVNFNGKEIIEPKYNYEDNNFTHFVGNYISIKDNNKYILLNKKGELLLKDYDSISLNKYKNNTYILASKDTLTDFYDNSLNLIKTFDTTSIYMNDFLVTAYTNDSTVYDLKGNKLTTGYLIDSSDNYLVFINNDKYAVYYIDKKTMTDYKYDKYSLNNNNLVLKENGIYSLYDKSGNKIKDYPNKFNDLLVIDDKFLLTSDGCDNTSEERGLEYKVYDNLGNVIINKCSYIQHLKDDYFVSVKDNVKLYKNNKLIKNFENYSYIGYSDDFYLALDYYNDNKDYHQTIFDYEGKKVLDNINCIYKINDYYYIQYSNMLYNIFDKDLNKISDTYFSNIDKYDGMYVYSDLKGRYGIYDNKLNVLVEPKYNECKTEKNVSVCSYKGKYEINIINYIKKKDLKDYKQKTISYNNEQINIDKIIEQYKLYDIKDIIENNKDYFSKYAYNVINNDKLGNYKKDVLFLFKVIESNKKYIDTNTLLDNVSKLKIEYYDKRPDFMLSYAVGEYLNNDIKIVLLDDSTRVLYHELMHFLQFNKNREYDSLNSKIYSCNGKYMLLEDMLKVDNNELCKVEYTDYLVSIEEASAEINATEYFTNGIPVVYLKQVQIYEIFKYLFGKDVMDEISFSSSRNALLFLKINDYMDYSIDEYSNLASNLQKINNVDVNYEATDEEIYILYKTADFLVDLYKKVKDNDWTNDIIFTASLNEFLFNNINYNSKVLLNNYLNSNNKTINYLSDYYNIKINDISNYTINNNLVIVESTNKDFNKNAIVYIGYNKSNWNYGYYIEYYDDSNNLLSTKFINN